MGFAFAETMAGWLEPERPEPLQAPQPLDEPSAGAKEPKVRYPFHFRIHAHVASTLRHLRDGKAAVTGVVHAPPFCEAADATGTLEIRPLLERVIRYRLTFHDRGGQMLTFVGQKNLSLLAPARTFTELAGELIDQRGEVVAKTMVHFDLRRDWLSFARSFHRTR